MWDLRGQLVAEKRYLEGHAPGDLVHLFVQVADHHTRAANVCDELADEVFLHRHGHAPLALMQGRLRPDGAILGDLVEPRE